MYFKDLDTTPLYLYSLCIVVLFIFVKLTNQKIGPKNLSSINKYWLLWNIWNIACSKNICIGIFIACFESGNGCDHDTCPRDQPPPQRRWPDVSSRPRAGRAARAARPGPGSARRRPMMQSCCTLSSRETPARFPRPRGSPALGGPSLSLLIQPGQWNRFKSQHSITLINLGTLRKLSSLENMLHSLHIHVHNVLM